MIGNGHDLIVSHPMHLQPFIKTTGQMSKFVALLLSAHVVPTPGCCGGNIGGGADKNWPLAQGMLDSPKVQCMHACFISQHVYKIIIYELISIYVYIYMQIIM